LAPSDEEIQPANDSSSDGRRVSQLGAVHRDLGTATSSLRPARASSELSTPQPIQ
jgi:hypothetical protein